MCCSRREDISLQRVSISLSGNRENIGMLPFTFPVWDLGVVIRVNGPSAHGFEGVTEVIMNGARVSKNPKTMNGMDRTNLVRRFSIAMQNGGQETAQVRNHLSYDAKARCCNSSCDGVRAGEMQVGPGRACC